VSEGRSGGMSGGDAVAAQTLTAEELLRLVEAGADWIWETDRELRFSWLSGNYRDVTGIAPDSVIGRFCFDSTEETSKSTSRTHAHLTDIEARRPFRDFVYELKAAKQQCRWICITGFPRFDRNGDFVGYRGIGRNVTSIKVGSDWIWGTEQGLGYFWLSSDFWKHRQLAHQQDQEKTDSPAGMSGAEPAHGSHPEQMAGALAVLDPVPLDVTGARVLIVDDNAVNRAILTEQMDSWTFDSCAAESGIEGIRVLQAAADLGIAVDCVVLDYQMPGMTGADVARVIRSTPAIAETPIVMLTSVDQSLSNSAYRDLGIEAQLIKPARSSALLEALVHTIQKHRHAVAGNVSPAVIPVGATGADPSPVLAASPAAVATRTSLADGHRLDVLVAEDNEVNQLVFTQILADTRYSFEIVANGRRAVETFSERNPRMILMDVSMPEMNGIEATAAIRRLEADGASHVPIVGVTTHALNGDRERCLDAGMDDYLPKPISPKALLEKLDKWTRFDSARQRTAG